MAFPISVLQHSLGFLYIFSCQFLQASPGLFVNNEWKHEITPPAPKMKQNWLALSYEVQVAELVWGEVFANCSFSVSLGKKKQQQKKSQKQKTY